MTFYELEELIQNIFNRFNLDSSIKVNFSNLENIDIQINSLIKHMNHEDIQTIQTEIDLQLNKLDIVEKCTITENGFINIVLSDVFFIDNLSNNSDTLKASLRKKSKNVFFDYGGANIGKSLHVGHLRTLNLGRSLKNIYSISGSNTFSDIHFGDWGMPIGLIIAYLETKNINIETINPKDLETIYPEANKLAGSNPDFKNLAKNITFELNSGNNEYIDKWQVIQKISKNNILSLLEQLKFSFDFYNGESDVVNLIPKLIENLKDNNLVLIDDGALISNDSQNPPPIIVKSDGSYNYLTTDLATVVDREASHNIDDYIYIVDQRQHQHFEQLFKLVDYFSLSSSKFTHVGFGTINGVDGKPMKTRDGGNYKLSDLLDDIKVQLRKKNKDEKTVETLANSVLTFSDLVNSRKKNYVFDIEKFTNINGKSAIYIQYSQVRARKLLKDSNVQSCLNFVNKNFKDFLIDLLKLDYFFNLSLKNNEPHHLGEYLFKLCQEFNIFYSNFKIFSENNSPEEIENYVFIIESFLATLEILFECLGIDAVDSM